VPVSDQYSLTLQNGYSLTQQGVVPVPGLVSRPARSYETEQSAKLSIGDRSYTMVGPVALPVSSGRAA